TTAREDRNFVNRIAILDGQADSYVSGFMNGSGVALVFVHHETLALGAHQNFVASILDVFASDGLGVIAGAGNGGLVQEIGQISSGKSRRAACDPLEIEFAIERNVPRMHFQNCFATSQVGEVHHDLAIESSGPRERLIED